jgi:tRNA A-37 threonylcarbamoyl transferase component Bud32
MVTQAPADLLDWLGRNLFLAPAQVDELRPRLSEFAAAHSLVKELIQRNLLTPYQANQILQGKKDQLVVGANRLLERIGEGAMGQVFRAWNARLGRIVAVKMIHHEHLVSGKALERFRREMQTAAQLDHPNILLVRDADEIDQRPYMVMDFIEGDDLSRRVKSQGPLPIPEAVDCVRQAALGLEHAYERGVVHRDIKPGNLLLTKGPDGSALVKILDFGLARLNSEVRDSGRLTQVGKLIGTVDYIAPEQVDDAHVADTRSDIYSLGCTLFYLLTGKPPFAGNTVVEKVTARRDGPVPSVRDLLPQAPPGLDAVMQRMMARMPEDRFQTPLRVAQALAPFIRPQAAEPTVAPSAQPVAVRALAPADAMAQAVSQASPAATFEAPAALTTIDEPAPFHFGAEPVPAPPVPDDEVAPAADTPRTAFAPPARPAKSRQMLWIIGAATLVLGGILAAVLVKGLSGPGTTKRGYHSSGAALKVLPLDAVEFKDGGRKSIIVRIERKEFRGPVKVRFESLPDGLSASEVTVADNKDIAEIPLTVSYGVGAMKRDLKLIATAENLRGQALLPLTVVATPNPPGDENDR